MNTAGKGPQNDRPGTKDKTESTEVEVFDSNAFQKSEMAKGGKDSKAGYDRKRRVGGGDHD